MITIDICKHNTYKILAIMLMLLDHVGALLNIICFRIIGHISVMLFLYSYAHGLKLSRGLNIKNIIKIEYPIQKKLLRIGAPFAAEQMFFQGGKMLTATFIAAMGTLSQGVNAISNSIMTILLCIGNALAQSLIVVCGQCMGRKEIDNARKYIKSFLQISRIATLCLLTVLFPMFPLLMKMYNPPPEIVPQIFIVTLMLSTMQPIAWASGFILPYALRAAGDSRFTSVASLLSKWL